MKHFATDKFWRLYKKLPQTIQDHANKQFLILKENPEHPSLHLKKAGSYWSVRVTLSYRAIAIDQDDTMVWFWIGNHREYEKLIGRK